MLVLKDAENAKAELADLRKLCAWLKDELFERCCRLQQDSNSVNLPLLATVAYYLRQCERRKTLLEHALAPAIESEVGSGHAA